MTHSAFIPASVVAIVTVVAAMLAACTNDGDDATSSSAARTASTVVTTSMPGAGTTALSPESTVGGPAEGGSFTVDYYTDVGVIDQSLLLNVSQGGYSTMHNSHWFSQQAGQLSSMGVQQLRFDHVFDDDYYHVVSQDAAGNITYDFSMLDEMLLPFADNGIAPFISLSYMPSALGPDVYGPPTSAQEWANLVSATVSHYEDRGYTGWSWEVWNEPDSAAEADPFWTGTPEQYFSLYETTAAAVKAADPTALVGGDAAAQYSRPFNASFLGFLQANPQVPLDFYAYHAYLPRDFSDDAVDAPQATTVRADLDAIGRGSAELFITEWNQSAVVDGNADAPTDTNSGASYSARRLGAAIGSELDQMYYFSGMDGDRPDQEFSGDLGLLTVTGHRKATANVFEMYAQLAGTRLEATLVADATDDGIDGLASKNADTDEMTVLLWNDTEAGTTVDLTLENLPYADSNFSVTRTRVSENEGNYYRDSATGTWPAASENAPVVAETVEASATLFGTVVDLPSHSVTLMTLRPTELPPGPVERSPQPVVTNHAATASGATMTASSSVEDAEQGWGVNLAGDGQRHSFDGGLEGWSSTAYDSSDAEEFIQSDFGVEQSVNTVTLWPRDSYGHDGAGFPTAFTITGSTDSRTWERLYTTTDYGGGAPVEGPQTFSVTPGAYRFIRVSATELGPSTDETGAEIYTFELAELEASDTGLPNAGFETTTDGWHTDGDVTISDTVLYSGNGAVQLAGSDDAVQYTVTGLEPNTTYTFGGYVRTGSDGGSAEFGVTDFGTDRVTATVNSTRWTPTWITFTTGPTNTKATVHFNNTATAPVWGDNFTLQPN